MITNSAPVASSAHHPVMISPWLHSPGKRVFDVICATGLTAVFLPVMAVVALGVKIDSPGDVLFKQKRVGYQGKPFDIFKFRSVKNEICDSVDTAPIVQNDSRLTPFGTFIRKHRLDELPQLLNVIKGDMSLVGPRALTPAALERLFPDDFWQERQQVLPGISSESALKGYRRIYTDPNEKQRILAEEKNYIQHGNFVTDLNTLLMTPLIMLRPPANNC